MLWEEGNSNVSVVRLQIDERDIPFRLPRYSEHHMLARAVVLPVRALIAPIFYFSFYLIKIPIFVDAKPTLQLQRDVKTSWMWSHRWGVGIDASNFTHDKNEFYLGWFEALVQHIWSMTAIQWVFTEGVDGEVMNHKYFMLCIFFVLLVACSYFSLLFLNMLRLGISISLHFIFESK